MNRIPFIGGLGGVAAGTLLPRAACAGAFATPPPEFSSNNNYFMYGGGEPIGDIRVEVDIDEDLVAPHSMSMQLNANSPAQAKCVYQQYTTNFIASYPRLSIGWSVENFPSTAFRWDLHDAIGLPRRPPAASEATCHGDIYNYPRVKTPFATYPTASDRLPAGFRIVYDLFADDDGRNVAVRYTVYDQHGNAKTSGQQDLHSFRFSGTSRKVGPDGVAPVLAFQMNLVGLHGGQRTMLTSGAGRITYTAKRALTAVGSLAETNGVYRGTSGTVESSNIVYSKLPAGSSTKFVQTFGLPQVPCAPGQAYDVGTKRCIGSGSTLKVYDQAPPQRPPR